MLGFTRTCRQERPNPYVVVDDIAEVLDAFATGIRAVHGKLLVSGIPRMTRPRPRKNAEGVTGFAVIDPGGDRIRFTAGPTRPRPGGGRRPMP
ncbi:VOC family protein [Streptomyces koyangensis]|uniref:hypothetical protein n=1 Tax=Streptomyces koyangensis TaxID=188770 RepID=UPI001CECC141|nr:hypothetical protein [Streptomyces koyangensis]